MPFMNNWSVEWFSNAYFWLLMLRDDHKHWWICPISIIMNLWFCGIIGVKHLYHKCWCLEMYENSYGSWHLESTPLLRLCQLLWFKFVDDKFCQKVCQIHVLLMPLMWSSSTQIVHQEHCFKENTTVANPNRTATKLKCLWPRQDKTDHIPGSITDLVIF